MKRPRSSSKASGRNTMIASRWRPRTWNGIGGLRCRRRAEARPGAGSYAGWALRPAGVGFLTRRRPSLRHPPATLTFYVGMNGPLKHLGKRLFVRLAVVIGGTLVVSFGFVATLSILPLRRGLDAEARDDLQWSAGQFQSQVQHYLDARCDDVRLWADLAPAHRDAPGPRTASERLEFLMRAAQRGPRSPYRRFDLIDRDGALVATSPAAPVAATAVLPHAPVTPGRCAVLLRPGGDATFTVAAADPFGGGTLVARLEWQPILDRLRTASLERLPQSIDAFLLLLDGDGKLLAAPEIPDAPLGPALEAAQGLESGRVREVTLATGRRFLATVTPLAGGALPRFRVAAFRSLADAHAAGAEGVERAVLAALLGLVLAGSLSFIF